MQYFLHNITMCYTEKKEQKKNLRVCHAQDVNLRTSRNSYVTELYVTELIRHVH